MLRKLSEMKHVLLLLTQHDKTNKMTCALSEDSDQPGHPLCTQWVAKDPRFPHADCKDSDQTGQMPRLI